MLEVWRYFKGTTLKYESLEGERASDGFIIIIKAIRYTWKGTNMCHQPKRDDNFACWEKDQGHAAWCPLTVRRESLLCSSAVPHFKAQALTLPQTSPDVPENHFYLCQPRKASGHFYVLIGFLWHVFYQNLKMQFKGNLRHSDWDWGAVALERERKESNKDNKRKHFLEKHWCCNSTNWHLIKWCDNFLWSSYVIQYEAK